MNEANLSFPEARDRLKQRVADENGNIAKLDKRFKEMQKMVDNKEKYMRDMVLSVILGKRIQKTKRFVK